MPSAMPCRPADDDGDAVASVLSAAGDVAAGGAACDGEGWVSRREPSDAELWGLVPDPDCAPPDGDLAWLVLLAPEQRADLAAELAARRPAAARESVGAGFTHRAAAAGVAAGEVGWRALYQAPAPARAGAGFAAGAVLDAELAGPVLASFAQDAMDEGLASLSDDETSDAFSCQAAMAWAGLLAGKAVFSS